MIAFGDLTLSITDPRLWAALAAGLFALLLLRAVSRSARATEPLARHLMDLDGAVRALNDGQQQLHGGITHVAEAQAAAQARMAASMETRLAQVTQAMGDSLNQNALRTARSLGDLQQRLSAIDKAQSNIEKLSGDVLGLQDILSNKQTAAPLARSSCARSCCALCPRRRDLSGDAVQWDARRLPAPPAPAARSHRHRREIPAGGL